MGIIVRTSTALFLLAACTSPVSAQGNLGANSANAVVVSPAHGPTVAVPPAWGTATESVVVVLAPSFNPPSPTVTYDTSVSATGIGLFQTSTDFLDWWIGFQLPSGAEFTRMTVEACDSTSTGQLLFVAVKGTAPAGDPANITSQGTTGLEATPGCAFFALAPDTPQFANNSTTNFWVALAWSGAGAFSGDVKVNAIRVHYKLRVSSAPGIATFADVPVGHPFYRFVEALAAAGISGGCGSGNYCPDAPLTRGQMAVFLAAALGLHFPN